MNKRFKIIGFDADDTLWINEPYFHETEDLFLELMSDFGSAEFVSAELYKTEMANLSNYGYGAKGFMLSMVETAMKLSDYKIGNSVINSILELGKTLINKPVILLEGVREILEKLNHSGYRLIIATKGDLLDQERKLSKSKIVEYFHHIEIMSNKKESDYKNLLSRLDIPAEEFLMVGNSLKSDILPVLNIGGSCIHIPYHTNWKHEKVDKPESLNNYWEIKKLSEIEKILNL